MKQVSVLFCDIVGSTPMTERLGAEAMRDLLSSFLKESLAEVHRYGGTAPQFTGDGFMALFGAPVAYEDHVRRCLLAALAIQRALSGVEGGQLDLRVRMGIHTGPVVFGPIVDTLPMDATAVGDTANIAARLQQAAEPGTILLSEATRLLAQDFARVEPVGPLALRGKAEPISAHSLLSVSHRRSGLREFSPTRAAVFVNRESELAILNNFLRQVEGGRSQAVGVVGEPGIGKSRLLAEFHRQLPPGRVTWVEGRCVSYGTAIPYWLLLDLLRSNCGIDETDTPEAITEKVRAGLQEVGIDAERDAPVLLHLLGVREVAGSPALSNPETVKAKAFEVFRKISVEGSRLRPVVLVLEDLHWVDKVSQEFLGFLAENLPDARILMLATYRPSYRPLWIDQSYAGQAPLQPLSRDDSLQVVRSVLDARRLVDLVSEEIVAKADGNPFFLEQLALHAGEARDLRSDLMVPGSIHDVVMARIDRLPDETKQLLQTAAVIGREFSLRLLSAVCKRSKSLEVQLRELTRLEFITERVEADGTTYLFRHALTQEAAYGSLLERHRRAYHGAVGQALEELYRGRAEEVAELLALHFGRSDQAVKSVDHSILAGEKSQRRWANSDALTYFSDALHRLDMLPDTEANRLRRIDAVLKQGDGKFALGEHAEHIQALDQIYSLIYQSDDPSRRATWHYWRGFGHILTGGHPDVAADHCNKAATVAAAAGLEEIKAYADCCLAQVYLTAGRLREAIASGERALITLESLGNLWWAGRTMTQLNPTAIALGEWDRGLSYCRRVLEYATTMNDVRLRVIGLWRTGAVYIHRGDAKRGIDYCDQALALGPLPYDAAMAKAMRGYGEIRAGLVDAGIADLSEAAAWFADFRLRYTYARYALWLAEGHLRRGDRATARSLIEEELETSRKTGYLQFEGLACWLMGECLASAAPAAAEPYLKTAMEILGRIGARNDLGRAMVTCAALRQAAGDLTSARRLLDQAAAIFRLLGTLDEPARVEAARIALDRGSPIRLLASRS
jgi:class 3 adenylate cyclase/tetratricopeptide (TPR) repeat protein